MKGKIKLEASKIKEDLINIRRHLHANPELSFQEKETSQYIKEILNQEGILYREYINTGILAIVEGKNPHSRSIALRADIDALPIQEKNDIDYNSNNSGVMHACGHDVHTTCLIGAIKILKALKDSFEGTVYCIFQPGEEMNPGGASLMIKEGILDIIDSCFFIAQHVCPSLKVGQVGYCSGVAMSSCDDFIITIKGKGGHAAMPQECINPINIASHITLATQQITNYFNTTDNSLVISIGTIETTDGTFNVIPDSVKLKGTIRVSNNDYRETILERFESLINHVVKGMSGNCDIYIDRGYPALVNDNLLEDIFVETATEFLGKDNVVEIKQSMTSEDFAYFSMERNAFFYRLGTQSLNGENSSKVHTNNFNVDENSLEIGSSLLTFLALEGLKNKNSSKKANDIENELFSL